MTIELETNFFFLHQPKQYKTLLAAHYANIGPRCAIDPDPYEAIT